MKNQINYPKKNDYKLTLLHRNSFNVETIKKSPLTAMDSAVATALKLGETKITGKCVGINPATGKQIVFSQDTVHVHVVALGKLKIVAPLVRIRTGAVMPATLWGVPDISPMIMGTLSDFSVTWSTDQPDVIRIAGIFSDAGIEYGAADSISVRVKALNPGRARIQAAIQTANGGKQTTFVEVTVFRALELESPKRIGPAAILLPPNFSINLKANLADATYHVDKSSTKGIVRITREGTLASGDAIGRDLIIATSMDDQTLPIPVEVKNIHYILASLGAAGGVKLKYPESRIPRGMNIILKITLHDNLGNEFSHNLEDINTLRHKLSRKEMADIHIGGNFTIGVSSSYIFVSLLCVFDLSARVCLALIFSN